MFRSFFDLLGFANDAFDFFFFMISFCGVWAHHTLQSMFMLPSPPTNVLSYVCVLLLRRTVNL